MGRSKPRELRRTQPPRGFQRTGGLPWAITTQSNARSRGRRQRFQSFGPGAARRQDRAGAQIGERLLHGRAPQDWMAANNDPAVKRAALIADEAVSALDVSVQPQVLELLDERLILILDAVIFVVEVCNKFDSCGTGIVYRCC